MRKAIVGVAGSGKTYTAIQILIDLLRFNPTYSVKKDVAFLTFTTSASESARGRVAKALDYEEEDLFFFRTLHSYMLYVSGAKVGKKTSLKQGEDYATKKIESLGDITKGWMTYKKDVVIPSLNILIIDEVQDLNEEEWYFVSKLIENAENVILAGDDDQAIFGFKGARSEYMLEVIGKYKFEVVLLEKTRRCPLNIVTEANYVLQSLNPKKRIKKYMEPEKEGGLVKHLGNYTNIKLELLESLGHVTILCYDYRKAMKVYNHLKDMPLNISVETQKPFGFLAAITNNPNDLIRLLRNLDRERMAWISKKAGWRNTEASLNNFKSIIDDYTNKRTKIMFSDAIWSIKTYVENTVKEALDIRKFNLYDCINSLGLNTQDSLALYFEVLATPESKDYPKVLITTIHRAKGSEWDNVILFNAYSKKWEPSNDLDLEDLLKKLLYVGITRAKEKLYFIGEKK